MPVPNTSFVRPFGAGKAFAQIVVTESYTFTRRMSTTACPHSLNTFKVSSYQN